MSAFHAFWWGDSLSPYEWLSMKSFVDHGHRYTLYTYRELEVPTGVELRDASAILPENRMFFYAVGPGRGSVAGFSNLFRYRLLHDHGGWWVDADVTCLSAEIPEPEIFFGRQRDGNVGNAILRFPPRHGLTLRLYDAAQAAGSNIRWGETGPKLMTAMVEGAGLTQWVKQAELSYPIDWQDALHVLMPDRTEEVRTKVRPVSLLHRWNEMFRRAAVAKWTAPPPGSYMAELFRAHRIETCDRAVYSADEISRLNANLLAGWKRKRGIRKPTNDSDAGAAVSGQNAH